MRAEACVRWHHARCPYADGAVYARRVRGRWGLRRRRFHVKSAADERAAAASARRERFARAHAIGVAGSFRCAHRERVARHDNASGYDRTRWALSGVRPAHDACADTKRRTALRFRLGGAVSANLAERKSAHHHLALFYSAGRSFAALRPRPQLVADESSRLDIVRVRFAWAFNARLCVLGRRIAARRSARLSQSRRHRLSSTSAQRRECDCHGRSRSRYRPNYVSGYDGRREPEFWPKRETRRIRLRRVARHDSRYTVLGRKRSRVDRGYDQLRQNRTPNRYPRSHARAVPLEDSRQSYSRQFAQFGRADTAESDRRLRRRTRLCRLRTVCERGPCTILQCHDAIFDRRAKTRHRRVQHQLLQGRGRYAGSARIRAGGIFYGERRRPGHFYNAVGRRFGRKLPGIQRASWTSVRRVQWRPVRLLPPL